MNRRERLMATLRGEPVDRPAVNFYEIGGFKVDPSDPDEFNIYNSPSWRPLLKLAEEQTDLIRMCSLAVSPAVNSNKDKFFNRLHYMERGCRFTRTTLKIGSKTLTSLTRRNPDIDTIWILEHLLKSTADVNSYLQLPDEVFAEDVDISSLHEEDRKIGERGIVMVDVEDPLCAAASLFSMAEFTIFALTEQKLCHLLLEKFARLIHTRTERIAKEFPGHLWRIYGPEYATEPYLPPHLFGEYVVRYTGPMVKSIQSYGGFARIHCHGKIKNVLDYIVEMGAAAIDPIEPPPQGNVDLGYVRRKYGGSLVLFGNIEIADIENMETADFEKVVERSLKDGTAGNGKGFVLMPSACPCGRQITSRTMKNYETMARLAANFKI